MGALVNTKGTRRLIRHFNNIFDARPNGLAATKAHINGDPNLLFLFSTPGATAPTIRNITNDAFFLPNPHANHANLPKRWKFFLFHELTLPNHELIRSAIWRGLNGTNAVGDRYVAIRFDCIEGTRQDIFTSDEYLLNNNDDDTNDNGHLERTKPVLKIVLVTSPTKAPDPIDDQGLGVPLP